MIDDRFERELRGFLAERAPATVSPALRARLHAVTAAPAVRAGTLAGLLGGAWRTLAGAATIAVAAVFLVVLLARPDAGIIRDPGVVGGPSAGPVVPIVPFLTAPTDFFSAAAVADGDRRLAAVFQTSGIEGRLIVKAETSGAELSTPLGWPVGYKADRDDDRDITAILGVAPDGTVTCCVTITGGLIERAREEGYWRPASWPERLEADLESDDPAVRDAALDRFVRGIESLAPGVVLTREAIAREATFRQGFAILLGLGMLAALLFVTRYRWLAGRAGVATDQGGLDPTKNLIAAGPAGLDAEVPLVPDADLAEAAPVPWTAPISTALPRDRNLLAVAAVALAGFLAVGLWDLIRPPTTAVPLDVNAPTIGLASPVPPFVPVALLGVVIISLVLAARNGRRARRVATVALLVIVGLGGWWAIDGARPSLTGSWIGGIGAGSIDRGGGGLFDAQTYPLRPDDPFTLGMTIRNRGALPVTILGLDGVQATKPDPFGASIVGLASVPQPIHDGTVQSLSARPEDARVAWPQTMGPGEELAIVLLGRAGPCAEPDGTGSNLPILHVQVTYRVLGIERN